MAKFTREVIEEVSLQFNRKLKQARLLGCPAELVPMFAEAADRESHSFTAILFHSTVEEVARENASGAGDRFDRDDEGWLITLSALQMALWLQAEVDGDLGPSD